MNNRHFIICVVLFFVVIGTLFSIDVVDQMATFIENEPPEQARYINNSGVISYVLTISDKHDSQETLVFRTNKDNKITQVRYSIRAKSPYTLSTRQVQNYISEIRYESETRTENADGVPYGEYKSGIYIYKYYILMFRVSYKISSSSIQSVEWTIAVNTNAPKEIRENGFVGIVVNGEMTIIDYIGNSKSIIIPNEINGVKVTNIGKNAFAQKRIRSVIIPLGIKNIEEKAFYMNELTDIIIPDSITSIGAGAFWYNNLSNITIPQSVTFIGSSAFYNNPLEEIIIGLNIELGVNAPFPYYFREYYYEENRQAGRYVLATINNTWWKMD
jgi:hypothetical protein